MSRISPTPNSSSSSEYEYKDRILDSLWPLYNKDSNNNPVAMFPRCGDDVNVVDAVRMIAHAFSSTTDPSLRTSLKRVKDILPNSACTAVISYPSLTSCLLAHNDRGLREFCRKLTYKPDACMRMLACAIDFYRVREVKEDQILNPTRGDVEATTVKLHSLPPTPLDSITSNVAGHLVSITGRVVKASTPRLMATRGHFLCTRCGFEMEVTFENGIFRRPQRCDGRNTDNGNACRSRTFNMRHVRQGKYSDQQTLGVQATSDAGNATGAPATVQVEVQGGDMVGMARAGDDVEVTGIVASMNEQHAKGRGGKMAGKHSLHTIFVRANNIAVLGGKGEGGGKNGRRGFTNDQLRNVKQIHSADPGANKEEETRMGRELWEKEKQAAQMAAQEAAQMSPNVNFEYPAIAKWQRICKLDEAEEAAEAQGLGEDKWTSYRNAFPFDLLVASLAPNIFGHDAIKAGLVLVLLGGSETDDGGVLSGASTRYNPHMLIVGDPGMGKSMLLRRTAEIAERSIYIGGNTTTSSGLTVSVVKDGGETTLEAGALVLADKGICCLDEFDKMDRAENALLECMEQQSLSVAKSGICTTLPARCSVIAAANPKSGKWNAEKSVAENLDVSAPILSRFDLCFVLEDKAGLEKDEMLARHVMNQRADGNEGGKRVKRSHPGAINIVRASSEGNQRLEDNCELIKRIKKMTKGVPPVPFEIFKDYIKYARSFCNPRLRQDAATELQDYYMTMKHDQGKRKGIPITTRQLESMVRLCQARAKACLRPYVTVEDVNDVIQLMTLSIFHSLVNEEGAIDRGRKGVRGSSKTKTKAKLIDMLKLRHRNGFTMSDANKVVGGWTLDNFDVKEMLYELNHNQQLLKQKDMMTGGTIFKFV